MNLDILEKAQNKVKRLNNIDNLIFLAMNTTEAKSMLIDLNQEQLLEGKDSNDVKIRTLAARGNEVYSLYTINIKLAENQPTNKVTLYDTGEFYNSFKIVVQRGKTTITANFQKEDGNIMENLSSDVEVLGLNNENLEEFVKYTLLPIIADVMKRIIAE